MVGEAIAVQAALRRCRRGRGNDLRCRVTNTNTCPVLERLRIAWEKFVGTLQHLAGGIQLTHADLDGGDAVGDRGQLTGLAGRRFRVSAIEHFQSAFRIAIVLAQVGSNQQTGNIEGLQVQHPLRRGLGVLVVAETDVRPRKVSMDRRIVRVVQVQVPGLIPGASKRMLVEQESHARFSQLEILRGEIEASGDGVRCLAIVVRRLRLVRAADEGQGKIVVGFRLLGVGCDLLPGGSDPLLSGSHLLGLAQQNGSGDKKNNRSELHHVPLLNSEDHRAHRRGACPETFGRVTELHHRAGSATALVCRRSLPLITAGERWLITATRFTGVDVSAIATAVSEVHIGEGFLCGHIGSSDTIADQVIGSDVELGVEHAAGNHASCNVNHIVGQTPPVGKACAIAGKQTQPAAVSLRCWGYAGV